MKNKMTKQEVISYVVSYFEDSCTPKEQEKIASNFDEGLRRIIKDIVFCTVDENLYDDIIKTAKIIIDTHSYKEIHENLL